MPKGTHRPPEFYTALPKVDLHRHLEGSLRLNTLVEIGQNYRLGLGDRDDLGPLVQVVKDDPYTFENFLSKFATLRLFFRSPKVIERITHEAIEDAALDNVRYLELRFTPVALSRVGDFPLHEVIDWVVESAQKSARELGIKTGLIASVNRHESLNLAEKVIDLAIERKGKGIVGIDLAGSEATAQAGPFIDLFKEARESGMQITIHAGEWDGPENVKQAITKFQSKRIGHGVRVMDDPDVVALARERGTTFEVCITSNYQSGVVPVLSDHPIARMLSDGLNATLNSDDPGISQIVLSDEVRIAHQDLAIPLALLLDQTLAAVQAAFLPDDGRAALIDGLKNDFQRITPNL